ERPLHVAAGAGVFVWSRVPQPFGITRFVTEGKYIYCCILDDHLTPRTERTVLPGTTYRSELPRHGQI
ncbi:MAG: hypothetical protein P8170_00005, partial [Gemmatimonadota bacterium]